MVYTLSIAAFIPVLGQILDKIFPDKSVAEQAKLKLIELEQQGALTELSERMAAIRTEASSTDPWTSRARPSFMYVIYILILSSLPVGFLNIFFPGEVAHGVAGFTMWLQAIPGELYALFGAGYLGYGGYRTFEKIKGKA